MCEWLCEVGGAWCDVRLQCGGRALPAHRAVLASVSAFLRRLLLSSTTEETPTLIVLPDFDLEAMSSVLYYIYKGEVVIQKHKLERFMEIVKAMQIFVDERYFPTSWKSNIESSTSCAQEHNPCLFESKAFRLGDGPFINLRKRNSIGNACSKNYNAIVDVKHVQSERSNNKTCFRNEQSSCGDRQKSFLHDLFLETYPWNGNTNGRTAGVLAIPSALYRPLPSGLLTNANGKHLHNTHEQMLNKPTSKPCLINCPQDRQCIQNPREGDEEVTSLNYPRHDLNNISRSFPDNFEHFDITRNYFSSQWLSIILRQNRSVPLGFNSLSERHSTVFSNEEFFPNGTEESFKFIESNNKIHSNKMDNVSTPNSTSPRAAILNQVLDSPWCPRQPTNYKPFRRKVKDTTDIPYTDTIGKPFNDDNNNVQTSSTADEVERLSANTLETTHPEPSLLIGSEFKCAVCDQVFTDSATLSAHSRYHSSSAKYSCTECSKNFSQLRNFKYHMSIHRGTREFAATCTVCGKYFNDRGYLSSHMKIHRNRKEYKCAQCPKSFNQRVAYNMHVRIHTGVKPHVCSECGKAFSRKMLLKQHQRTHSGERPYACPHCDKRFADRSNMSLHLRLHTGIKPFSCTLCPKSFTKKHHLKSHLNFHTGAKPYSCPKCKLAFTQSSNMRTHLKKCTAPDPIDVAETQTSS